MRRRNGLGVFIVAAAFFCPAAAGQEAALTEDNVAAAISAGVEYVYSAANKEGVWDEGLAPTAEAVAKHLNSFVGPYDYKVYAWGGRTALALNALALSGRQGTERFRKATAWLMKQDLHSTYAIALRMQLVQALTDNKDYLPVLQKDYKKLMAGARPDPPGVLWQYGAPPIKYPGFVGDYSNTNYAVLGIWAAGTQCVDVPREVWRGLERAYIGGQDESGGWAYLPAPSFPSYSPQDWRDVRGSMTAAAIASLYLIIDHTADRDKLGEFHSSAAYKSLGAGLKWLGEKFSARENPGHGAFTGYYFYNVERVAAVGGLKYIGKHDWFREIASTILAARKDKGQVSLEGRGDADDDFVDTCFSLMFLATGSAPVMMSKVQHEGDWDNRLRDLAGLTWWLAVQSERPANWQVVNLDGPPEDLTDSRILYLSGVHALKIPPEKARKLKRFVELGGLLVFQSDVESPVFNDSAKRLLEGLWPGLMPAPVDLATHPLGSIQYPLRRVKVDQFAGPTRVYAFVLHGAPARSWEARQCTDAPQHFQLGANLHYFATDRAPLKSLPTKLTYFAEPFRHPPPEGTKKVVLARIKHGQAPLAWDPEPLAFERLSRLLAQREGVSLEIKAVEPGELAGSGAKFAHLTGWDELRFTPEQSEAIVAWVKSGGTLIVDQAGGGRNHKAAFDRSFRLWVAGAFGEEALGGISSQSPLPRRVGEVVYHNFQGQHVQKLPPSLLGVEQGGRVRVIYSPADLTNGMLDVPNPMAAGMGGESVYRLFKALLLPEKPATAQAATSQASRIHGTVNHGSDAP